MKISIKGYIAPKEAELYYDCADRYAYNTDQNKFALSDGVSKSFFPKIWADVLVNQWVQSKEFEEFEFIKNCQKNWLNQVTEIVEKPDARWFTKNAFNRNEPGLATFVSLQFFRRKDDWCWKANALGDSFLFFIPKDFKDFDVEIISHSSKSEPIVFDNFPDYLSSRGNNHKGEKKTIEKPLSVGTFYLLTDALAEWFLEQKENAINKIKVWQSQTDFERFVNEERLNKNLGNDDSAILIIEIENDNNTCLNYISEAVSNIDELIKEQQEILDKKQESDQEKTEPQRKKEPEKGTIELVENNVDEEINDRKIKKGLFQKCEEFIQGKSKMVAKKETDEFENTTEPKQKEMITSSATDEENIQTPKTENNKKSDHSKEGSQTKDFESNNSNKSKDNITSKF